MTPDTAVADELADLWVKLAADQRDHGSHLRAAENRSAVREQLLRQLATGNVRVVRADGDIVGFVSFDLESGAFEQDVTRGIVENLYVVPEHRGEGHGTALLHAAEDALAKRGVDHVTLEVLADNERARRFYRRHGYGPHRIELESGTDTHSKDDG